MRADEECFDRADEGWPSLRVSLAALPVSPALEEPDRPKTDGHGVVFVGDPFFVSMEPTAEVAVGLAQIEQHIPPIEVVRAVNGVQHVPAAFVSLALSPLI